MKFLSSLLEKAVSSKKVSSTDIKNSFDDHLVLATCVLLIEVARSDDNFDDKEKQKILEITKQNFDLSDDQTKLLMCIADDKNK